jgi:hypothetical protein
MNIWKRYAKIRFYSKGEIFELHCSSSGIDGVGQTLLACKFNIDVDIQEKYSYAELQIMNLSNETIARIVNSDYVEVHAGYEHSIFNIFIGFILNIYESNSDIDRVLHIDAISKLSFTRENRVLTIQAGQDIKAILSVVNKNLIKITNLENIGNIFTSTELGGVTTKSIKYFGTTSSILSQILAPYNKIFFFEYRYNAELKNMAEVATILNDTLGSNDNSKNTNELFRMIRGQNVISFSKQGESIELKNKFLGKEGLSTSKISKISDVNGASFALIESAGIPELNGQTKKIQNKRKHTEISVSTIFDATINPKKNVILQENDGTITEYKVLKCVYVGETHGESWQVNFQLYAK